MIKKYIYIIFVFSCLSYSYMGFSQTKDSSFTIASSTNSSNIEGLSIFPNPVTNGKLYITTKNNLTKDIEIFDVLGKKVFTASLFDKELNISKLTSGVYILKIKENNITATRKLVIR